MGTVQITREGLYCRIACRCRINDSEIHRLYADGDKIGVLMPDRGGLVLETRLPAKRLKADPFFSVDGNRNEFVPIRSGKSFPHLDKLRLGKLSFRDGKPGILLES